VTGTLALLGGGEFAGDGELDRELLRRADTTDVLVLPTADAFEHPERLVEQAAHWFATLCATARGLDVLTRPDALAPPNVQAVRDSRLTYLAGDSPMHLRSVLKATPLWDALVAALDDGAVIAASGGSAMAVCDPMTDPRGGAFTLGLGLVRPLAVVPARETWSPERLHRTRKLAEGFPVVEMVTGAAIVRDADGWQTFGEVEIHAKGGIAGVDALPG
jgi:cyanophycinase